MLLSSLLTVALTSPFEDFTAALAAISFPNGFSTAVSKQSLVPDPSSRVTTRIASSRPPSSFQFVISPAKIFAASSNSSPCPCPCPCSLTGLLGCRTIATLSFPTTTGFKFGNASSSFAFTSREAAPMSISPAPTAFTPCPDPPPETDILSSGFCFIRSLAHS